MEHHEKPLAERVRATAERIVRDDVLCCVSVIVSDVARAAGETPLLRGLCDEATELCAPAEDWEEAAREEGWFIACSVEDDGGAQFFANTGTGEAIGADEIDPGDADAWRELCERESIDPQEREIFEHWAVSSWLAGKLGERGERVGDFGSLTVWGRSTTGQAIVMDRVIQEIAHAIEAERDRMRADHEARRAPPQADDAAPDFGALTL